MLCALVRDDVSPEPDVQWVATWDHATERLVIHGGLNAMLWDDIDRIEAERRVTPIRLTRARLLLQGDEAQRAVLLGPHTLEVADVDAGAGETVLVLDEGNSARQILGETDAPVRSVIVGIIDEITTEAE